MGCGAAGGGSCTFVMLDMWNMTQLNTLLLFVNILCFFYLLRMTSYLVNIATDSHETYFKMCLRDIHTATENGRRR